MIQFNKKQIAKACLVVTGIFMPSLVMAAEPVGIDSGDTAWVLTSTALVLFMTIPGLALFYAGMVRSKNVLSVLMQCFAITALTTVVWVVYAYSLAFGEDGLFWGGFGSMFLSGLTVDSVIGTIPESVFMIYQMTFAIITATLIVGAFVERMKFSAVLVFSVLWISLVYAPICHWVRGEGGWLTEIGFIDFAGGTVQHVSAGMAGLMAAIVVGKRRGYPNTAMPPHNLGLTVLGASMLWVGWFGFNAASGMRADGQAGMAMVVTQIAAATAALSWMLTEWKINGKPSVLGTVSGAIAGLVAITPAAANVGPMGALAIGMIAGIGCLLAATKVKYALGYDDSLDVFGLHAVGGALGTILVGIFCAESFGGLGFGAGITDIGGQLAVQSIGTVATAVYSCLMSYIILMLLDHFMGLRVSEGEEIVGLDIAQQEERGYIF